MLLNVHSGGPWSLILLGKLQEPPLKGLGSWSIYTPTLASHQLTAVPKELHISNFYLK